MALRKYYMHMTQQTYEEIAEGIVRVTNRDGKTGVFQWSGEWIEGELREASTNMLVFAGGRDVHPAFNYRWTMVPADRERASGWPEDLERHLETAGVL